MDEIKLPFNYKLFTNNNGGLFLLCQLVLCFLYFGINLNEMKGFVCQELISATPGPVLRYSYNYRPNLCQNAMDLYQQRLMLINDNYQWIYISKD